MDFKEQVKNAADIVEIVSEVVRLKPAGGDRYKGLCPFHQEKTSSFGVDRAKQFFYCFGCQKGGDVFTFLMEIEGVGFFDALKSVAERYGLKVPQRAEYSDTESRERDALLAIHEIALTLYRGAMNVETRTYLERRGVAGQAIDEFAIGYAPGGGTLFRRLQKDFSPQQLAACGLIVKRDDGSLYDRFRNRVMFPIHNEAGKVIAFGGRALGDDEPKYLNSSDTKLYTKKRVLYNLHRAKETIRKQDYTILVEGYMDVIGVAQAGVKNVVASCGTALSEEHVRALRRHSDRVVVNFDPDAAGANAAERSIQILLDESMRIRILILEGDLDPDEYIRQRGADDYRGCVEKAGGYFHWLADRARQRFDMRSTDGRMQGFRTLLAPALNRIPDRLERLAVVNDVAGYLGVDARAILDQIKKNLPASPERKPVEPKLNANETLLIRGMLENPGSQFATAERLSRLSCWKTFEAAEVLNEMVARALERTVVMYDILSSRLEENARRLLAAAVFADKSNMPVSLDQLEACLLSLETAEADQRTSGLRQRIRALEKEGRLQEALMLQRQLPSKFRAGKHSELR